MCPPETNCLPPQDGVSLNLISLPPNPISPVSNQSVPPLPSFTSVSSTRFCAGIRRASPASRRQTRRSEPTPSSSIKAHYNLLSHRSRRGMGQCLSEPTRKQMATLNKSQGCSPGGDSQLVTNRPRFLLMKR